jgi:hypothetical protein
MEDRGEYRTMHVAILDNDDYICLSKNAKLILHTLKLELGRAGIGLVYPGRLEFSATCSAEEVRDALRELEDRKWIEREKYIIWLRNGLKFERGQNLGNPAHVKGIVTLVLRLPRLEIIQRWFAYYRIVVQGINTEADVRERWATLIHEYYGGPDPYDSHVNPDEGIAEIVPYTDEEVEFHRDSIVTAVLGDEADAPKPDQPESGQPKIDQPKADQPKADAPSAPKPRKPRTLPAYTDEDMRCAAVLQDQLTKVFPDYMKRAHINMDAWADQFRLIRTADRRAAHDTLFILQHFTNEPFWRMQIRSPALLRGKTQKGKGEDRYLKILADVSKCMEGHDGKTIPPEYVTVLNAIPDTQARRARAAQLLGDLAGFDTGSIGL